MCMKRRHHHILIEAVCGLGGIQVSGTSYAQQCRRPSRCMSRQQSQQPVSHPCQQAHSLPVCSMLGLSMMLRDTDARHGHKCSGVNEALHDQKQTMLPFGRDTCHAGIDWSGTLQVRCIDPSHSIWKRDGPPDSNCWFDAQQCRRPSRCNLAKDL